MSAFALLAGRLAGPPGLRNIGQPNEAAVAPLIVEIQNNREFWTLFAYDERRTELLALDDDAPIAVTGEIRTRVASRDGAPSVDRTLIVRSLLALPAPPAFLVDEGASHEV